MRAKAVIVLLAFDYMHSNESARQREQPALKLGSLSRSKHIGSTRR
jgi:hypothetical protein